VRAAPRLGSSRGLVLPNRQVFSDLRRGLNAFAVVPTTRLSLRMARWSLQTAVAQWGQTKVLARYLHSEQRGNKR